MRNTLLALLAPFAMACPGFAQVDTSILKAGNTWEYEFGTEARNTGSLESGFKGTALFRIDTVRESGPDSILFSVSRLDSGMATDYSGSRIGKTLTRAVYLFTGGDWHPLTPDQPEHVPFFAFGGLFSKPFRWAVLGDDTLRINQKEPFIPNFTCVPSSHRYLESVGLIYYSNSAHCGITSNETHYRLISRNGKPFQDSDVNVLPLTFDFAPYALGKYWEYRVVESRKYSEPIFGSPSNSVDSLLWAFQVVGLGSEGDSLIILEANVQGRKGISQDSRGDTVNVRYLDTTLFRGGSAYPSWDPRGKGGSRIAFDYHTAFQPFYEAHGAVLGHLPKDMGVRDTLMDGGIRKLIFGLDKESEHKESIAFVQGVGLVRKSYAGFFQVMPSSGSQEWSGNIVLIGTGSRPVGIAPRRDRAHFRKHPAVGTGIHAGAVWADGRRFGGLWFGADGRRLAPDPAAHDERP